MALLTGEPYRQPARLSQYWEPELTKFTLEGIEPFMMIFKYMALLLVNFGLLSVYFPGISPNETV
ncbi:hypothetical protein TUM17386_28980 [Shewanella algae]|nr:hypothetical protein TUM17386_28980 [Shewanella algae]